MKWKTMLRNDDNGRVRNYVKSEKRFLQIFITTSKPYVQEENFEKNTSASHTKELEMARSLAKSANATPHSFTTRKKNIDKKIPRQNVKFS